jgi:hypothetical protein
MTVKDLRLGNLVQYVDNGEIKVVSNLVLSFLSSKIQTQVPFEPILLTTQWVINLGFSQITSEYYGKNGFSVEFGTDGIMFIIGDLSFVKEIKYVHELQNLYYSLTDEELEYDEKKID